ncbi:MAG: ATP-binding cassette domain-containing protein, partial [Anaerolineaceae bacterium]|nr:ATP-binding cassette domain-containing protein [Anaerolineaceae bacterium]
EVLGGLATLYESNLFLTNLYDFLDLEKKVGDPETPKPFPSAMSKGIAFDHVSFTYANSQREALCDVSLEIHPGEVIAFVGENGSGKTTLVKLLCRLYEPTQGAIRIDGLNLRDFRISDLRKEIGVIFQDYAHYNLPARENIWFGDIDQPAKEERIQAAAIRADAHKTILSLKQGYDTVLGKLFENGEELSIGQWQKIALARAFLRNSQVIVLDEPTSAMDPRAEYEVFLKFRELLENRTAILISHRLSTVRMADRIYVMQGGKIIENGTHAELVAQDGLYARLYEIQARQYQTTT